MLPNETRFLGDLLVDDNDLDQATAVLQAIPSSSSVVLCSFQSMQDANAELDRGKELKLMGATAVMLEEAAVGDGEDLEYAAFCINGLTKKKSSTFNMSGLARIHRWKLWRCGEFVPKLAARQEFTNDIILL